MARTGRVLERKLIHVYGQISSYESQSGSANGQDSWGAFRRNSTLNEQMLARALASQLIKASTTKDPGTTVFLFLHGFTFEIRGFV